jgi:creatinine amidohydrolase
MRAESLIWEEYRDEVGRRIVILPAGSMEQHGPHLPLNVDVVIPTNLADRVAEKVNGLVLPTLAYGYKSHPTSGGGQLFPGTTSLNGTTLINMTLDILNETYRHGGRRFLVLNGHYENLAFVNEAIELFTPRAEGAKVVLLSWWDQVSDELTEEIFAEAGFPGWDTEHAGITETALMLHFAPELVRKDSIIDDQSERKPTYSIYPPPSDIIPRSGVLYKATYASPEIGAKLADHVVDNIVDIVNRELS